MTPEFREGVVVSNCDRVDDNVTGLPGSVDIDDTLFFGYAYSRQTHEYEIFVESSETSNITNGIPD